MSWLRRREFLVSGDEPGVAGSAATGPTADIRRLGWLFDPGW